MNWKRILSVKFKLVATLALGILTAISLLMPYKGNPILQKEAVEITFINLKSADQTFRLITATTNPERARGLMFVGSLPPSDGMIFIFPEEAVQSFWMYNTFIPLDIIFIDHNNKVVHIAPNALPHNTNPFISSIRPVKYAIEIAGGLTEKLGIDENSQILFAHDPAVQ